MSVANALVPPRAYDELHTEGVQLVISSLFAVDCQTCGKPFDGAPPAVQFRRVPPHIEASLHHSKCAEPAWIEECLDVPERPHSTLHYYKLKLLWSDAPPGYPRIIPLVAINPSLEAVTLTLRDGQVRVRSADLAEFQPYAECVYGCPTPGVHLVVDTEIPKTGYRRLWVLAEGRPLWALNLQASSIREIRDAGGMMLVATHQVDPMILAEHEVSGPGLHDTFNRVQTYAAWATFLTDPEGSA